MLIMHLRISAESQSAWRGRAASQTTSYVAGPAYLTVIGIEAIGERDARAGRDR